MESIRLFICALLLSPVVALAQAEEPEATSEEPAVEEVPADEAAPVEEAAPPEATEQGASSDDAAAAEQGADEASAEAPAGPRGGHQIDVFYLPTTEIDLEDAGATLDERGDGFGGRGLFRFMQHYAVSGEYQSQKFGDNDEIELTQQRLGLGFVGDDDDGAFFGLFAEYDKLESDEVGDLDGYSVHGRLAGMRTSWLGFYGDVGYLRLESDFEKYSGNEMTLGVLFKFGEFGVFADARRTDLKGKDSGVRSALTDVRTGLRYEFGAIKPE